MVRLNEEQVKVRERLAALKKRYEAELSDVEAAYVEAKERLKQPIREAVADAEDVGMPQRQIHLALGFAQISSLASFLLPSKRYGGSLLYTGRNQANPVAASLERVASTKPEIRQKKGEAFWNDPETGEEKKVMRIDGPVYFYHIFDSEWAKLTAQEQEWFRNDAKTLIGEAEFKEYFDNGNEPERWDGQPDAKRRN